MHPDEANQALRTGLLLEQGLYRYDPRDQHGPTLYYLTLPVLRLAGIRTLAGMDETMLRLVPALFGCALLILTWAFIEGLGLAAVLGSTLFLALSPAMVYYSQFYIQETLLVFFTAGVLVCGWRFVRRPTRGRAVGLGFCLGMMAATKETCVLSWAAMGGALFLVMPRPRWQTIRARRGHLGLAAVVALATAALFFSSFGRYPGGLFEVLRAAGLYLRRAGDPIHRHPPWFYLRLLLWFRLGSGPTWSEAVIVAPALFGGLWAWLGPPVSGLHRGLLRFLAAYTAILLLLYSLIPYKTPWCVLSILYGAILLAGAGIVAFFGCCRRPWLRVAAAIALLAGTWRLGQLCRWSIGRYCAAPRNPWAYAQTSTDLPRLARRIQALASLHPDGNRMLIHVIAPPEAIWPLPWYLRRFPRTGYWTSAAAEQADTAAAAPPILVTTPAVAEERAPALRANYFRSYYGLRPGILLELHVREDLWQRYLDRPGRGRFRRQ